MRSSGMDCELTGTRWFKASVPRKICMQKVVINETQVVVEIALTVAFHDVKERKSSTSVLAVVEVDLLRGAPPPEKPDPRRQDPEILW